MKDLNFSTIIKNKVRDSLKKCVRLYTDFWKPYSRLVLVSDSIFWVISWEMKELACIAQKLGIRLAPAQFQTCIEKQVFFFGSHFDLFLKGDWFEKNNRLGTAYFHGKPGIGSPEFDECYEQLCRWHHRITRLQVSNSKMRNVLLESGINPSKVHQIPIGINLKFFHMQTPESRYKARLKYKIPQSAVVIGSFQKDGVGWGEGMEPKMIKGPDIFLKTLEILKPQISELFVLLSGPARGYVKTGLKTLGIPYQHYFLKKYPDIGELFQALDAYLVTSRDEGGPKAVLESMASGVPLITTYVGQAADLVKHGENSWMVDVGDVEGLAHWAEQAFNQNAEIKKVIHCARLTAKENSYESQLPLWKDFMQRFVEWK